MQYMLCIDCNNTVHSIRYQNDKNHKVISIYTKMCVRACVCVCLCDFLFLYGCDVSVRVGCKCCGGRNHNQYASQSPLVLRAKKL